MPFCGARSMKALGLFLTLPLSGCIYVLPPEPRVTAKPPVPYSSSIVAAERQNLGAINEDASPIVEVPAERELQPEIRPEVQQEPIPDITPSD